jgi:(R,R)-butanediol dehydrogenase/meso-butanediol dehydrogenase/diacetyl reductase
MRAAYYDGNRKIRVGDCEPVGPGPGQVQLRVSYCGICGTDLHLFHGNMDHRVHTPHVFGHEMSGTVAAVGPEGAARRGDRVVVRPLDPCNDCPACRAGNSHICQKLKFIGIDTAGALQGLWTVPAHTIHHLPASLSMKTAAMVEPVAVACHAVRRADLREGEYVVIQGGGPIGMLIALVARSVGARVTILEVNPFRIKLARDLGFEVLNPKDTDVVDHVTKATKTAGADVVFEVSGAAVAAEMMTKLAKVRGKIVIVAVFPEAPKVNLFQFFWRELTLVGTRVYQPQDFDWAIELSTSGKLPLDRLITEVCSLDAVESALHRLESGGEVMKILVECSPQ